MAEDKSRFRPSEIPGVGRISRRLDWAIRWRIEEALGPVRDRLDALERRVNQRLPQISSRANLAHTEMTRLEPQVASLEQRMEELRVRVEDQFDPGTSEERTDARRLIEEIRAEHERIRSRMTAISWYEDRLRKLEERMPGQQGQH
jgi:chromosome segregation ATPase